MLAFLFYYHGFGNVVLNLEIFLTISDGISYYKIAFFGQNEKYRLLSPTFSDFKFNKSD